MIGSDVTALFPSMTADRTAAIIRNKIEESEIDFEGFDLDRGRTYVAINLEYLDEKQQSRLRHLLPTKTAKQGIIPTMASIGMKWNPRNQWDIPEISIEKQERKAIIAAVVEIAIKVLFKNFSYKFWGEIFPPNRRGAHWDESHRGRS